MQIKSSSFTCLLLVLWTHTMGWGNVLRHVATHDSLRVHHYYSKLSEKDKAFFLSHKPGTVQASQAPSFPGKHILQKGIRIFGWHPYWLHNSYRNYNYSLLTHVAYFSCEIDPSKGTIIHLNGWDTSAIVPFIKSQNPVCQVLLTVGCFNAADLTLLLGNKASRARLIDQLYLAVTSKKGDGVCIDFEGIPVGQQANFTSFITDLKKRFSALNLTVTLTLPAVDSSNSPFDLKRLENSVDFFVLMAYGYFGGFSNTTGPVAPIKLKADWITESIETSVDFYLLNNVPDSMLVLGVPYYGALWQASSPAVPSKPTKFMGYRPYSYALADLPHFINDTVLQASYYSLRINERDGYQQFWIDDVYSLGLKYDYVLEKKLGGVGIWALGFDEGSNDLWNLLKIKFAQNAVLPTAPTNSNTSGNPVQLGEPDLSSGIIAIAALLIIICIISAVRLIRNRDT